MNDLSTLERLAERLLEAQGLDPRANRDGMPRAALLARDLADGLEGLGVDWVAEEEIEPW